MESCVIEPHTISEPLGIVSCEPSSFTNKAGEVNIFGGFSKDGCRGWVVTDSALDVVCTKTGNRLSSFNFSQVAGSSSVVTCVKDYFLPGQGSCQLLVGLRTASNRGMVCRFHPHSSKVLGVVAFPQVVTSVEPVTSVGGTDSPNYALSDQLRRFFGIVAVGTAGGHVFLLDAKLDEEVELWGTPRPRQAQMITPREPDVDQRRVKASGRGEHLCLDLNGESFSYNSFNYCKPDGSVFKTFPVADVSVTSLTYIPQIGSLAVGFSFGSFQLWRLADSSLEYSGPLSRHPSPVTQFAYQEPEDDPQNFCYLWVARGPVLSNAKEQESLTDIHLFQLAYENKTQHPKHGHMFRDLVDCIGRFEHCLTCDPLDSSDVNSLGSRLLACYTLDRALPPGYKIHDDSTADEEVNPMDLRLVMFVWEGCPNSSELQDSSTCHYIALFDLDRYYQAQMPAFIKPDELRDSAPYFSFYNLEAVVDAAAPDFALNVHLDNTSLTRYQSTCQPVPEQHLHPSSLDFSVVCLAEGSLVHASFLGIQRKILSDMNDQGPSLLREPRSFYMRCWNAHLIPKQTFAEQAPTNTTFAEQREALLTLSLEHNMLGFLVSCISSWSQGDFTSGMNLRSILEWAWGTVAGIKQTVDEICVSFYDGYGTFVDSQTFRKLETCSTQLRHMITLFQALLDQSGTTTEQGVKDLETKLGVVTLLSQHLEMVLWFAHSGLLPECGDDMGSPLEGQFGYPTYMLRQSYAQRRAELARMCRHSGSSDILLIDGLVSEAGSMLTSLWDRDGGTGSYPPSSLHALLDIYLLENVSLVTKHCIVGYLLLDIISVSNDAKHAQMVGKIEQFHHVFSLPLGMTKLLQAFWLLDHRDYEEALAMLLDPNTNNDVLSWQHTRIIKTFLYHGQAKMALHYVRCIKPTLETPDDVKLHLTVLLANGLTAEAFQFQREYRDLSTMDELLYHIFLGSQQTKTMDQLLRLPFDDVEEAVLERYLLETTEPNSKELLVMHYLQRTRFVDAVRLNEKLKQQALMGENNPLARERTSARNIITESYVSVLPRVQRRLAFDSENRQKKPVGIRREVPRPKPLSAVINPAKSSKVISHALLLNAVLDRIAEAREVIKADQTPTKNLDETFEDSPSMEPFVGTPMTPRNKTIRSADVSVVYPETIEAEESAPYQTLSTSLNVSITQSLRGLSHMETPRALKENFRPTLDYTGADALSLLQTPPVNKRRMQSAKKEPPVAPPTPQSILKVRKVIRRSPSPPKLAMERAQGLAAMDTAMPTPPTFQRKTLSFAEEETEKPKEATPGRHIRFSDDTISPGSSPDINDLLPEPPTFALRQDEATPSPVPSTRELEQQAWSTPPISPSTSPTKDVTETPPFQSPQEQMEVTTGVVPEQPIPGAESPVAMEAQEPTPEVTAEEEVLILTPKMKAPTPKRTLILTPKMKPPTANQMSAQRVQQQEVKDEVFLQAVSIDDDSPTPPMPEGLAQRSFLSGTGVAAEEEDSEQEVTFNFSLRGRHEGMEGERVAQEQEQATSGAPEGLDDVPVATVTTDDNVQMEVEGESESRTSSTSPVIAPDFYFNPSPRPPIHRLSPFKFEALSSKSASSSAAADVPGTSTELPSPPRVSRDLDIEQAFLDQEPMTEDAWHLTLDTEEEEDAMDDDEGQELVLDDDDEEQNEEETTNTKVTFGKEEVFEIPSSAPKQVGESVHIQTSPMSDLTSDVEERKNNTQVQEMSVQTTPGLALRGHPVEKTPPKTPPRVPFKESLKHEETRSASPPRQELGQATPPQSPQSPRSPRSPRTKAKTPPRSSPRIKARQQHRQEEEPSTPSQPSFIFSPPLTRSKGRRSARKTISRETAAPPKPSSQQPSETFLTLPSPSPLPGESLSLIEASGGRGTRRGRARPPSAAATGGASMTQIKEKPAIRNTRRSHLPSPAIDDDVLLLSPATPDPDSDSPHPHATRRNPRRAVRVAPHSMTLRTPQERKKNRKVKAW